MNGSNRFSFKAWDKVRKIWIHEKPCNLIGETILLGAWLDGVSIQRLNDIVVLQSTGMCDKNGIEIFENDVAEFRDYDSLGVPELGCDTIEIRSTGTVRWSKEYLSWVVETKKINTAFENLADLEEVLVIGTEMELEMIDDEQSRLDAYADAQAEGLK